jgi:hypothetical protein
MEDEIDGARCRQEGEEKWKGFGGLKVRNHSEDLQTN